MKELSLIRFLNLHLKMCKACYIPCCAEIKISDSKLEFNFIAMRANLCFIYSQHFFNFLLIPENLSSIMNTSVHSSVQCQYIIIVLQW